MEDSHAVSLNLDEPQDANSNTFFAVYDGHGGMVVVLITLGLGA
jgi:serine/threonine protein phosphatase PrpC